MHMYMPIIISIIITDLRAIVIILSRNISPIARVVSIIYQIFAFVNIFSQYFQFFCNATKNMRKNGGGVVYFSDGASRFLARARDDVLFLLLQEKIPKEADDRARNPQHSLRSYWGTLAAARPLSVAAGDGIVRTWRHVNADPITSDS